MNIIGEKTVLRAISLKDAPLLHEIINDKSTELMLGGKSAPVSLEAQERWILNQTQNTEILRYIITEKNGSDEGLGTVILSDISYQNGTAQIHIKMGLSNCRRKGYGSDALISLCRYAFAELRLNCIYAEVLEYNDASRRLFEKNGFKADGILRQRVFKQGRFINVYSYSLLKEEMQL